MNDTLTLSRWQEIQAAMLHHFASPNYLAAFAQLVRDLGSGCVDIHGRRSAPAVAKPRARGYNGIFMGAMQKSLDEAIALRRRGIYAPTYMSSILRHAHETEMQYASPEGWAAFETVSSLLSERADPIDRLVGAHGNDFDDFTFAYCLPQFAADRPASPRFRIRTDIVCACGDIPARTGVYLAADDAHASLRFAWSGPQGKPLGEATTFNLLGQAALAAVGRDAMWFDAPAMHAFTRNAFAARALAQDAFWDPDDEPDLAPSLVARNAFVPVETR